MGKHILEFSLFESDVKAVKGRALFLNQFSRGQWRTSSLTGEVTCYGDFNCSTNMALYTESLASMAPETVYGDFNCGNNSCITTLEGSPSEVGGSFFCNNNSLKNLNGSPKKIPGDFVAFNNLLESLEGSPSSVGGYFDCQSNNLKSLLGAPTSVGEDFNCSDNPLISLEGIPDSVKSFTFRTWNKKHQLKGWETTNSRDNILWEALEESGDALLFTGISIEYINEKMSENPGKTIITLKSILGNPDYSDIVSRIKIPKNSKEIAGHIGDLGLLGF